MRRIPAEAHQQLARGLERQAAVRAEVLPGVARDGAGKTVTRREGLDHGGRGVAGARVADAQRIDPRPCGLQAALDHACLVLHDHREADARGGSRHGAQGAGDEGRARRIRERHPSVPWRLWSRLRPSRRRRPRVRWARSRPGCRSTRWSPWVPWLRASRWSRWGQLRRSGLSRPPTPSARSVREAGRARRSGGSTGAGGARRADGPAAAAGARGTGLAQDVDDLVVGAAARAREREREDQAHAGTRPRAAQEVAAADDARRARAREQVAVGELGEHQLDELAGVVSRGEAQVGARADLARDRLHAAGAVGEGVDARGQGPERVRAPMAGVGQEGLAEPDLLEHVVRAGAGEPGRHRASSSYQRAQPGSRSTK